MPAIDVSKKAQQAGLILSVAHIYKIRSIAKKAKAPAKAQPKAAPAVKAVPAAKAVVAKVAPLKAKAPVSKTRFVLGLPLHTPAAEVVAKAKSVGFTLTEKYVYNIRSKAKTKGKSVKKVAAAPKALVAQLAKPVAKAAPGAASLDQRFVDLVLEVGLGRAADLLQRVQQSVKAIRLG